MKKNRLLFGPLTSVASSVARAIERAQIDPLYQSTETVAHKCAFIEQGVPYRNLIEAEVADIEAMRDPCAPRLLRERAIECATLAKRREVAHG